jgi:hypothetical protein
MRAATSFATPQAIRSDEFSPGEATNVFNVLGDEYRQVARAHVEPYP